ncbi:MAG: type II toxin-antitoxin system HicA family toxin [Chloroflexia bacterium]|nr:type II toxin-antitoxin system HicA family toxin [Chloroflexia bacterium]
MGRRSSRVTGKDVVAALRRLGYDLRDVRGSHHTLRHPERGGRVTVPVHGTDTLAPKTLQSILDQAGLTEDELREAM